MEAAETVRRGKLLDRRTRRTRRRMCDTALVVLLGWPHAVCLQTRTSRPVPAPWPLVQPLEACGGVTASGWEGMAFRGV